MAVFFFFEGSYPHAQFLCDLKIMKNLLLAYAAWIMIHCKLE